MAEVQLKKICKKFDEIVAVDDFNLTIADKEFDPTGPGRTEQNPAERTWIA